MSTIPTGTRIKIARTEAKLTQKGLAAISGIAQANISRYETGELKPQSGTVDALMAAIAQHRGGSASVALDAVDGLLGIVGRTEGKLNIVLDPMAKPIAKDWVVDGFMAKRNVTIVAGQEGAGKSMLSQTLAAALINGDDSAFGFDLPGTPQRVLIVDVENVLSVDGHVDPSIVTERLQAYGLTEHNKQYLTIAGAEGFDLDDDSKALDAALGDAAENGTPYDVVIFDSFRSLWTSGSENTGAAGRVLIKYMRMAHKHNAAMLVLHHTNKAGAAYSGHTSIGSTVSAVWTFSKMVTKDEETGKNSQHPTLRYLKPYKNRLAVEASGTVVRTSTRGIIEQYGDLDDVFVDEGSEDDEDEA